MSALLRTAPGPATLPEMTSTAPSGTPSLPSRSCVGADSRLAMPKSSTLMVPDRVSNTFSGLRSRWTIPRSCA